MIIFIAWSILTCCACLELVCQDPLESCVCVCVCMMKKSDQFLLYIYISLSFLCGIEEHNGLMDWVVGGGRNNFLVLLGVS
jgi:hypothetical protein